MSKTKCTTMQRKNCDDVINEYKIHLDILRMHIEVYFKRIQIVYFFVEGGLISVFIALYNDKSYINVLMIIVAFIGILVSDIWKSVVRRQHKYLELCRDNLRKTELKLKDSGYNLQYYSQEQQLFWLERFNPNSKYKPSGRGLVECDKTVIELFLAFWSLLFVYSVVHVLVQRQEALKSIFWQLIALLFG